MKKIVILLTFMLAWVPAVLACTNFPINIGAIDTLQGHILVESLSVLINERTGVTVGVHYFNSWEEMDKAVAEKRLEIIIQDTTSALEKHNVAVGKDPDQNLASLQELYKSKELIWLKPFVFQTTYQNGNISLTAPVISRKSLSQFPALPRLIQKLTKKIDNQVLLKLVQDAEGLAKPKTVAKDFLKVQSLI